MAHALQDRYSSLVDAKLRLELVKKPGVVFNTRYEGNPTAGAVKIPVRDTEVAVNTYNKASGATLATGTTTYLTLNISNDVAVNELIDGYDAAAVPDNIVADRLDSAAYALAFDMEGKLTAELEGNATAYGNTTALTSSTAYKSIVECRATMTKAGVPNQNRFLIVNPDLYAILLQDANFIHASDMGDDVLQTGIVGRIAGFNVIEDATLDAKTEYIAGHPDYVAGVDEWSVPIHVQDLNGSGTFIGASAVQGRKVFAFKLTKAAAAYKKVKA